MPCVAHLMLVMLRLTLFVAHLILVMVLNLPEQCSFQDLLFHLLFVPKSAEKSASRMDISLESNEVFPAREKRALHSRSQFRDRSHNEAGLIHHNTSTWDNTSRTGRATSTDLKKCRIEGYSKISSCWVVAGTKIVE